MCFTFVDVFTALGCGWLIGWAWPEVTGLFCRPVRRPYDWEIDE